jgi:hypothetical protein
MQWCKNKKSSSFIKNVHIQMQKFIVSFRVQLETNHIKGDNASVHMSSPYNYSLRIRHVANNFCKFHVMFLFSWMFWMSTMTKMTFILISEMHIVSSIKKYSLFTRGFWVHTTSNVCTLMSLTKKWHGILPFITTKFVHVHQMISLYFEWIH